jgi:hypothetical protein
VQIRLLGLAVIVAFALLTNALGALASSGSPPLVQTTGTITVADRWVCHSAVSLDSVTVTSPSGDAVQLGSGCTGRIGQINVPAEVHGDPIHVGAFAHDLVVGDVELACQGHDAGKHQDGIQVMGGRRISFLGGTIACASANNSQFMVHTGDAGKDPPDSILFQNLTIDPRGAGAYGMALGAGTNLRVDNVRLLSHANRHDCYIGATTANASFTNMSGAAWSTHTGTC